MRRNDGFTLVELLAVIVLVSLLLAIAVPNALSLNSKVKAKAYETKIDLIEQGANNFGLSNLGSVRQGVSFRTDEAKNHTCVFNFDANESESVVNYKDQNFGFSETYALSTNEYWCSRVTIADLVKSNNLDWDEKGKCSDNCDTEEKKAAYDNVVLNPKSGYIINNCYVYIYYKNKRVYSYFDVKTCNTQTTSPTLGYEYHPLA